MADGSPRGRAPSLTRKASFIRAKDAIGNADILHAPPLIKARLLLEMAMKGEYKRAHFRQFAKDLILNAFGQDCFEMKREITNLNLSSNFVDVVYVWQPNVSVCAHWTGWIRSRLAVPTADKHMTLYVM